jgi:hypothetical protein
MKRKAREKAAPQSAFPLSSRVTVRPLLIERRWRIARHPCFAAYEYQLRRILRVT